MYNLTVNPRWTVVYKVQIGKKKKKGTVNA